MKKGLTIFGISLMAMAVSFTMPEKIEAGNYGMAGCGLGAKVMGPKGGQLFASTTNQTLYNQVFGITTGTSECTPSQALRAEVQQKVYAHQNYAALQQEVAVGQGENLTSFAYLLGCSADAVPMFGKTAKSNYNYLFPDEKQDTLRFVDRVKEVVKKDKGLASACKNI